MSWTFVRYPVTLMAWHLAAIPPYVFFRLSNTNPNCALFGKPLKERGDINASILQYQLAIDLNNDISNAWLNLGIALSAVGRDDEAMSAYKVPEFPIDLAMHVVGGFTLLRRPPALTCLLQLYGDMQSIRAHLTDTVCSMSVVFCNTGVRVNRAALLVLCAMKIRYI